MFKKNKKFLFCLIVHSFLPFSFYTFQQDKFVSNPLRCLCCQCEGNTKVGLSTDHESAKDIAMAEENGERRGNCDQLENQVFMNHLIVERIAHACDLKTLRNFRLVCRTWHKASLERWYGSATICLHGHILEDDIRLEYFTFREDRTRPGIPAIGILDLKRMLHKSRRILGLDKVHHFRCYKIFYGTPHLGRPMDKKDWDFWDEFGPSMTSLCLENCSLVRVAFDAILDFAPNLNSLQLTNMLAYGESYRKIPTNITKLSLTGCVGDHIQSLFAQCPKLVDLKAHCFTDKYFLKAYGQIFRNDDPNISRALRGLDTEEQCFPTLEALTYTHRRVPLSHLPSLESLSINFEKNVDEMTASNVLKTQSKNLKRLTVFRYPIIDCEPFKKFPSNNIVFDQLTYLTLKGNVITDFQFLSSMPNLKQLLVDRLCYGEVPHVCYQPKNGHTFHYKHNLVGLCTKYYYIFKHFEKNPSRFYTPSAWNPVVENSPIVLSPAKDFSLQTLEYIQIDYQFDSRSLLVLSKWLPNVTVLKTILDNNGLQTVCKSWSRLNHLNLLLGSNVDDEGITGIVNPTDDREIRMYPNLTDLTCLRIFELEALCGHAKLTENSAKLAFLRMRGLQKLIISCSKMTKSIVAQLHENIREVQLYVTVDDDGNCQHNEHINCCDRTNFIHQILYI